jgi:hypothetical protein
LLTQVVICNGDDGHKRMKIGTVSAVGETFDQLWKLTTWLVDRNTLATSGRMSSAGAKVKSPLDKVSCLASKMGSGKHA